MIHALPIPLLALSFLSLTTAQQLALNEILPLSLDPSSSGISLALPSAANLTLSVALCSSGAGSRFPVFLVRNGRLQNGTVGDWFVDVEEGIGVWTGGTSNGDSKLDLSVEAGQGTKWDVQVGISNGDPLHSLLPSLPLLGDTSSTQALFFSPPFGSVPHTSPTFPNYTLPSGNITSLPSPSSSPNYTMIFAPTNALQVSLDSRVSHSGCAIVRAANSTPGAFVGGNGTSTAQGDASVNASMSFLVRDWREGFRAQWVIEGLSASTNYTAWVVQDAGKVFGPIFAFTKSASFPCTLAHSLPYCPLTSYSIPLPPPSDATTYTSANLPSTIASPLISSISNFTTALLTFPCGRDIYSFKQTCEDCQDAYRNWACAVSLPRCGELPPSLASSLSSAPTQTSQSRFSNKDKSAALPTPALLSHPQHPVRTNLSLSSTQSSSITTYSELLPCLETCHTVDRACPPMFGWKCPLAEVNANYSYGVGFIDGWDGTEGKGNPGVAVDRWGVAWCNG